MAIPKRWSRTVGTQRGNRIRVYEREPGGTLHAAVWDPERQKYKQTSLGHRDRERALREVDALVRLRESGEELTGPLTLGTLVARFLAGSTHTRDGSLKTAHYVKGCARFGAYMIEWFGAETPVSQLTPDRMPEYAAARRSGKVSGTPVGQTAVHTDLKLLKQMMTWATMVYENGRPLLDRNPLTGFAIPKTRNPLRPLIEEETVEKLRAVADRVSPLMPLLITVMDSTGRRLSSVLGLRWDDFDFEKRTITWRAELDKKRRMWIVPMPKLAEAALLKYRAEHPAIGKKLLGQGEFDLLGFGTALRDVEDFEGDQLAGLVVVEDHPGLLLVALGDLRPLPEHNGEGVGMLVVLDLHAYALQYLAIRLVR